MLVVEVVPSCVAREVGGVVAHEEPELVLDDGTADVEAVVVVVERGLGGDGHVGGVGLGVEVLVLVVAEDLSVVLVGAALGEHVEEAARGGAVLGVVAARVHFHLADEVVVQVGAEGAGDRVRRVEAVDEEDVLGGGGAGHAGVAARTGGDDRGGQHTGCPGTGG